MISMASDSVETVAMGVWPQAAERRQAPTSAQRAAARRVVFEGVGIVGIILMRAVGAAPVFGPESLCDESLQQRPAKSHDNSGR